MLVIIHKVFFLFFSFLFFSFLFFFFFNFVLIHRYSFNLNLIFFKKPIIIIIIIIIIKGVYVTSKAKYAEKYCQGNPKVFVIGFVIVGNPFPVIEHPFKDQKNYNGKPIKTGYQSHFTLGTLFPLFFSFSFITFFFFNEKLN